MKAVGESMKLIVYSDFAFGRLRWLLLASQKFALFGVVVVLRVRASRTCSELSEACLSATGGSLETRAGVQSRVSKSVLFSRCVDSTTHDKELAGLVLRANVTGCPQTRRRRRPPQCTPFKREREP